MIRCLRRVEYCCVCLCGLLRPRRREACREGNGCCHSLAQVGSRVKAGNCLLTMPDNRCFLAFFVLVGDRRGRDVICCDWFWMTRFCLKVRIHVVFIEKG